MSANDLDPLLPASVKTIGTPAGNEWVLTFEGAEQAIQIATANSIAVLGVELVQILTGGLGVEDYSGYEFSVDDDWPNWVDRNNQAAIDWIRERKHGGNYGYILTSASESELDRSIQSSSVPSERH